jgi:RNA polymerase sigma factor (sigma-70 family)
MGEMQERSDAQLLREYAEGGSEPAFREIVTRHTDFVYSAALRQVESSDLARDVAQSVFTDLARKARPLADKMAEGSSLVGWLYRSTRFAALNQLRDDRRRLARERLAMEQLITDSETAPDWEGVRPVLDEAMADLSDEDREALLLRFFKNHDFRAVGHALGVSDDAAQKRVSRAVERLREMFAKRGVTIAASGLITVISANAVQAAPVGLAVSIATAALAGVTIASTATATATKTVATTTLQKTVAAALAVAVGAGIYEAKQSADARSQARALQQQQAPLAEQIEQLRKERDDATNRLAAITDERPKAKADTRELLKLRGEVALLRKELAQSKAKSPEQPDESARKKMYRLLIAKQKIAWTNDALEEVDNVKAKLGLSAEQAEAMREVFLAGIDSNVEIQLAQTEGMSQAEAHKQFAKLAREQKQAIGAVLAPSQQAAYEQLKKAEERQSAETWAQGEASAMNRPLGLSPEQTKQVISILTGLYGHKGGGSDLHDGEQLEPRLRALASVLTPEQQEIYRQSKLKEIEHNAEMTELLKKGIMPVDADGF